jgi:hypothetical protein
MAASSGTVADVSISNDMSPTETIPDVSSTSAAAPRAEAAAEAISPAEIVPDASSTSPHPQPVIPPSVSVDLGCVETTVDVSRTEAAATTAEADSNVRNSPTPITRNV